MHKLRALWLRLWGRHKRDDLDAELHCHIDMHIEDGLRAGMTSQEARRQALLRLGGWEQTRQVLGASRAHILRLIAAESARLIGLGAVVGVAGGLLSAKLLRTLLFHVGPRDPISLASVILLLAIAALVATIAPARAAMKTDPMEALRAE